MPNTLVRAAAEGMPINDPVVEIGLLLAASFKRSGELQGAGFDDPCNDRIFDNADAHEQDRSRYLAALMSTVKATSLEGAALQIAQALSAVDIIRDQYPEEHEGFRVKEDFRGVERLLFSALAAVDAAATTRLAALSGNHFGISWTDPWLDPHEEVKRRRAEAEAELAARSPKGGAI